MKDTHELSVQSTGYNRRFGGLGLTRKKRSLTKPVIVGWLRVICRLDRDRVAESMKFGTKNLVGIKNKFRLSAM